MEQGGDSPTPAPIRGMRADAQRPDGSRHWCAQGKRRRHHTGAWDSADLRDALDPLASGILEAGKQTPARLCSLLHTQSAHLGPVGDPRGSRLWISHSIPSRDNSDDGARYHVSEFYSKSQKLLQREWSHAGVTFLQGKLTRAACTGAPRRSQG